MKKTALRTDDRCFENLPGFPFAPHYIEVKHPDYHPLRYAYIDEGNRKASPILLLHGCPAWSYLYRTVIPPLVAAGHRVIVPDHIGCGRSDKLLAREDYSYDLYVQWLQSFITQMNFNNITLVCQDWGGPIGLRTLASAPERFDRIVVSNTLLPNCDEPPFGVTNWPGDIIKNWIDFTASAEDIPVGGIIQGVTVNTLPEDVLAAYDAPFPDASYKQGIMNWPSLIPVQKDMPGVSENRKTWEMLENMNIPLLTAFSDSDPTTAEWETVFQQRVKSASNLPHAKILSAGHMVQEDKGEEFANIIAEFVAH